MRSRSRSDIIMIRSRAVDGCGDEPEATTAMLGVDDPPWLSGEEEEEIKGGVGFGGRWWVGGRVRAVDVDAEADEGVEEGSCCCCCCCCCCLGVEPE